MPNKKYRLCYAQQLLKHLKISCIRSEQKFQNLKNSVDFQPNTPCSTESLHRYNGLCFLVFRWPAKLATNTIVPKYISKINNSFRFGLSFCELTFS